MTSDRGTSGNKVPVPGAWPLVGRGAELAAIAEAIAREDCSGVVFAGPPGVGKTRLATEALAVASRVGFDTARAMATQAAASIPLGALAPLLDPVDADADVHHDTIRQSVAALAARADRQPFMLLVDDAHLLDDASATVLHALAVDSPVFVVVTQRSGETPPDAVSALWKEDLALRIDVGPLGPDDVEALLTQALGDQIDRASLQDLCRASDGNPLFLRELVVGAAEAGFLIHDDGVWRLSAPLVTSPRLAELVDARLADLDDSERAALEVVAFGEPLSLPALAELVGDAELDSLERRGLLAVDAAEDHRAARLVHPIHGEVLRGRTPALRAMAIQRRLAATVLAVGRRQEEALRVAIWTLEAEGPPDPALMQEAARQALFAHDHALAERLARISLDHGGGIDASQILGEALYREGHHEEAVKILGNVVADATADAQRARIALTLAEALFNGLGRVSEAGAVLEALETAISEPDWLAESAALRASYELLSGSPHKSLADMEPLLTGAHPRAFVIAGTIAAPALAIVGRCDEAVALADRSFATHLELGPQELLVDPGVHLVARAFALGEAGRLLEAQGTARVGYDGGVSQGSVEAQAWFALILGRALWLADLREALRWFHAAADAFTQMGYGGQRRWGLAGAAMVSAQRGDTKAAGELLGAFDDLPSDHLKMMLSDVDRSRAWVDAMRGDVAGAETRLLDAADTAQRAGCPSLEVAALHDVARLGRPERVVDRLGAAAKEVDGDLASTRAEHAAALAAGDPSRVEAAAGSFEAMGACVLAAEACAQASGLWRRQSERRSAQRCSQQASVLSERAGHPATPAMDLSGPTAALSRREREVTTLAAEGLTNREIAERLYLSVRTVANHLQRAYEKLGVGGRDQLAELSNPGALAPRD